MESLLLEYHDFGQNRLAPAFAALYEVQMSKRDATDRLLAQLLQQHGNNVQSVVDAIKTHKSSTPAPTATPDTTPPTDADMPSDASQKSAVATLKHALTELPKLAQKADQLVADPGTFIKNKAEQIKVRLDDRIGPTSKFKPTVPKLKQFVDRLVKVSKDHPKKTSFFIAGLGVLAGLLTAGGPWVGGAFTAVMKLILMVMQGRPFGEAVKEVLKSTSISLLLGFGISSAIAGIDSMLNSAQASSAAATASDIASNADTRTPEELAAQLRAERYAAGAADVATSTANAQAATDAVAGAAAAGDTVARAAAAAGRAADALAGVTNADIPTTPVVDTSYVGRLRQLVDPTGEGTGIPTMNQSNFGAAFRTAREAMGAGNVFVWNGNAYTTNTKAEGLLNGLSDEVKRFLRGTR